MNESVHVPDFLLERYRIGEVRPAEKLHVEQALSQNPALAATLEELDRADRVFKERFPPEMFLSKIHKVRRFRVLPPAAWLACAAVLVLGISLPLILLRNYGQSSAVDRIKGAPGADSCELSVYLGGQGGSVKLENNSGIQAGSTIQLAYRVQPGEAGEKYGVIFSIDGRSTVTMHYPYGSLQSTQLVSGRPVPLAEAYTLDDAPDYEIFYFLVDDEPVNIQNILNTAVQLAGQIQGKPQDALQKGSAAFRDYELQILTLFKDGRQ